MSSTLHFSGTWSYSYWEEQEKEMCVCEREGKGWKITNKLKQSSKFKRVPKNINPRWDIKLKRELGPL